MRLKNLRDNIETLAKRRLNTIKIKESCCDNLNTKRKLVQVNFCCSEHFDAMFFQMKILPLDTILIVS